MNIDVLPMDTYQQFLAQSDVMPATVYHHPLWLEAVQDGLGMKVIILGVYDGQELLGVLPGFVAKKYVVRLFGAPLRGTMTPYLGWLYKNDAEPRTQAILDRVQGFCSQVLHCQYAEIGFIDAPADSGASTVPDGWHVAQRETYMLDLRMGLAALWKNLEQRGRYEVKKATKLGVVIESVSDRRLMDDFYPMLEATYGRHHAISPHPKHFFLALHDRLVPHGMMEVLAAKHDGRVIAIGLFVHDEREIRFMSGASLAEYHQLRPNNLMQWHLISWAAQRGLSRYDLGGKGHATIDKFKETFGPTVHSYTYFWTARPPLAFARNLLVRTWPQVQWWRYRVRQMLPGTTNRATKGQGRVLANQER